MDFAEPVNMRISFRPHTDVQAGLSERIDGSMVWWNRKPVDETIRNNRDRFFTAQSIDYARVVTGGTVHGTRVAVVDESSGGAYLLHTDALITNTPNLFLTITAADCMPIYFYDPVTGSIGIAHAGWRGLVGGILEAVVENMKSVYGAKASDLVVRLGPHIQSCHFVVKEDVANQFDPTAIQYRDGRLFANLFQEAQRRLDVVGVGTVSQENICTYCHADQFFSARHDQVTPLQGMLAYIGLRARNV